MKEIQLIKPFARLLQLLILVFAATFSYSQNKISGKIVDEKTQKPITGVEIFINNKEKSEMISADGKFQIQSDSGVATATFVKKNFKTEIVNFQNLIFENLTVKMQPEKVEQIQEVVLVAENKKKYKNKKENPAYAIMQEVWKRKKTNGLANYDDYQFKEYEKIEIGISNIDSAFMDKKIFNKLEFVFKYADSPDFD
ncbi:MAG TPA: carboxypeptidase-like regulatory domain-containing protein, partial [Kaistella sp.]|nr:carboxypeptidase-like regulatory domain-containing protein [Kaistella sp.]